MESCTPNRLAHNAINRSKYIGFFTTAAAVFSVSSLTWSVVSEARDDRPPATEPLLQDAREEMRIIGVIALIVNIGWLVVAALLVAAVKTLSPRLTVPFIVQAALYLPFCLGVAGVCLRRLALLSQAGLQRPMLTQLISSTVMCLLAGPAYIVLMLIVAAGRRQMIHGEAIQRMAKD